LNYRPAIPIAIASEVAASACLALMFVLAKRRRREPDRDLRLALARRRTPPRRVTFRTPRIAGTHRRRPSAPRVPRSAIMRADRKLRLEEVANDVRALAEVREVEGIRPRQAGDLLAGAARSWPPLFGTPPGRRRGADRVEVSGSPVPSPFCGESPWRR
jgi:hypothetical protein